MKDVHFFQKKPPLMEKANKQELVTRFLQIKGNEDHTLKIQVEFFDPIPFFGTSLISFKNFE